MIWTCVGLDNNLANFSQTTTNKSTQNGTDEIQMGISSIKKCLLGPKRIRNEMMEGKWLGVSEGLPSGLQLGRSYGQSCQTFHKQ
jgi:hypothetical protein